MDPRIANNILVFLDTAQVRGVKPVIALSEAIAFCGEAIKEGEGEERSEGIDLAKPVEDTPNA